MNKTFLLFFLIFFMPISVQSVEKFKTHPKLKTEMTVASAYLIATSLFSIYFFWPWYMDLKKINECNIYCDQCNRALSVMEVYGYFASAGDFQNAKKLKQLLYKANVDKINQYLLKINTQEETECVTCHDYCGWHIKKGIQEKA